MEACLRYMTMCSTSLLSRILIQNNVECSNLPMSPACHLLGSLTFLCKAVPPSSIVHFSMPLRCFEGAPSPHPSGSLWTFALSDVYANSGQWECSSGLYINVRRSQRRPSQAAHKSASSVPTSSMKSQRASWKRIVSERKFY